MKDANRRRYSSPGSRCMAAGRRWFGLGFQTLENMKITVKTLQQKVFQIDAEGSDTIGTLKIKIEEQHNHPVSGQKLIYSGKVLSDDKTVESLQFKEKDFLVLMVAKPKATPAASSSSSTPPVAVSEPLVTAAVEPAPVQAPVVEAPVAAAAAPASEPPQAPGAAVNVSETTSFLSGSGLQTSIAWIEEMGFPHDEVLRAMRASYNNPSRAVEYLMTGIPAHLDAGGPATGEAAQPAVQPAAQPAAPAARTTSAPTQAPTAASAPQSVAPPASTPASAGPTQPQNLFQLAQQQQQQQQQHHQHQAAGGTASLGPLDIRALRNNPQIQQLRGLIRTDPTRLQSVIQQLVASNPQIAQMIAQNPDILNQLLANDGEGGEEDEGSLPPGVHAIAVTEEERAAIERLEALGFPRQAAIEAYFACDKNEELAANYLFDGGFED